MGVKNAQDNLKIIQGLVMMIYAQVSGKIFW